MRSKPAQTPAQDIAKLIRKHLDRVHCAVVGALLLSRSVWAKDRRRLALRGTGWCLFGIGIGVLLVRRVGGTQIVDAPRARRVDQGRGARCLVDRPPRCCARSPSRS